MSRTSALGLLAVFLTGCGERDSAGTCGSDNAPVECTLSCDPSESPSTCPSGYHCNPDGRCDQACVPGSDDCGNDLRCSPDGRCVDDTCVGLECFQVACSTGGTTSISGVVYAPNGTLPLSGVSVYVPNGPVAPLPDELTCERCSSTLSSPLVRATTDAAGRFTLTDVPATTNVPLILQIGRWRRQLTVAEVPACADTALDATQTRLPRNRTEGDLPRIAVTTGSYDAFECLLRKAGIDDAEFTVPAGNGRVHLYVGNGTDQFDASHGSASFPDAQGLWGDVEKLSKYDAVFMSCEGDPRPETKPTTARAALKAYADRGGRVFATHYHLIWIDGAPQPWPMTITRAVAAPLNTIEALVDQSFSRGADLARWLVEVGASTTPGKLTINGAKHTVAAVAPSLAQRWVYFDDDPDGPSVQHLEFTTPLEAPEDQRCGRVVYSDIHVASDRSATSYAFPSGGCITPRDQLTAQEKLLIFSLFDLSSCIPDIIL